MYLALHQSSFNKLYGMVLVHYSLEKEGLSDYADFLSIRRSKILKLAGNDDLSIFIIPF